MTLQDEFEKRGIKNSTQSLRPLNFIGADARETFDSMTERMRALFVPNVTDVATIGDAYDNGFYQRTDGSLHRTYEHVFGDIDWSRAAEEESTLQVLEEVYGGNDSAPAEPTIVPSDLQHVYGKTQSAANKRTIRELAAASQDAQNNTRQRRDTDTQGIRGVEDLDAPIDPFA